MDSLLDQLSFYRWEMWHCSEMWLCLHQIRNNTLWSWCIHYGCQIGKRRLYSLLVLFCGNGISWCDTEFTDNNEPMIGLDVKLSKEIIARCGFNGNCCSFSNCSKMNSILPTHDDSQMLTFLSYHELEECSSWDVVCRFVCDA